MELACKFGLAEAVPQSGLSTASLETVNQEGLQKLSGILTEKQYLLYQELRARKKQEKDKYLKEHSGFEFTTEDIQMDF